MRFLVCFQSFTKYCIRKATVYLYTQVLKGTSLFGVSICFMPPPTYGTEALCFQNARNKRIKLWGQKVKCQGHSEGKICPKMHFLALQLSHVGESIIVDEFIKTI